MYQRLVSVAVVALAAGCVGVQEQRMPDGKVAYRINCSSNMFEWEDCRDKAASLCGAKGYSTVSGGQNATAIVGERTGGLFGGTPLARVMTIQCKD